MHRERLQPSLRDAVPFPLERDRRIRPELTHHLDLFLFAAATVAERLVQRLVLDLVPTDSNAKPELAARQDVNFSRLFGDENRLPLRENDHAGHEFQIGDARQVAEEDERLVKLRVGRVGAAPIWPIRRIGADHMIVGQDVRVAEPFGGLGVVADYCRVWADFDLR